jgi:acyl phosphate:glycerol-3-phosphate acyltransferase
MIFELALVCIAAYLIGSIPFGLLLTKAAGLGDIRQIGSGNIGATNVLRTGNKKLAALTLFLDGFKGWVAIEGIFFVLRQLNPTDLSNNSGYVMGRALIEYLALYLSFFFVVIGHCFPIWLKFKGGKGVATTFGAILGLQPWLALTSLITWLSIAIISRRSSLAALSACVAVPMAYIVKEFIDSKCEQGPTGISFCEPIDYVTFTVLGIVSLIVIYRHKENIKRLIAGTEPKIGKKA